MRMTLGRSPAIQTRFPRFRGTVQQGPVQRQETQIVQSCNTLDDFLPSFAAQVTCHVYITFCHAFLILVYANGCERVV